MVAVMWNRLLSMRSFFFFFFFFFFKTLFFGIFLNRPGWTNHRLDISLNCQAVELATCGEPQGFLGISLVHKSKMTVFSNHVYQTNTIFKFSNINLHS